MSETPKKGEKADLTISNIYETLKSRQFLRSLYWDVLSDLKEKPTFKRMRETIRQLVQEKIKVIENLPANEFTGKLEKKIASELCSLTITADIVCSKILHVKISREFKPNIINIIKELRNDGEIPDEVWAEIEIPDFHDENTKKTNNSAKQKPESPVKSPSMPGRKEKENMSCSDEKLQKQRNVTKKDPETEKKLAQNKMETRSHAASKMTSPKKTSSEIEEPNESPFSPSTSKRKSPRKSNSEDSEIEIDVVNSSPDEKESDAESNVSIGRISLTSVSSVHTSDLSSFDDEVSISSRDGTRMRVSLNEALAETVSGRINGFGKILTKGQYQRHYLPERSATSQEQLDRVIDRINIPALLLGYENIHRPRPEELPEVENPRPNRRGRNRVQGNNHRPISAEPEAQESQENQVAEIPRGRSFQERRANRLLERSGERNIQGVSHRRVPEESQVQDIRSFERKRGRNLRVYGRSQVSEIPDDQGHSSISEETNVRVPEKSNVQEQNDNNTVERPELQTSGETIEKPDEDAGNESLASTSSKRVRKPNSKYSSDTMVCHAVKVKDRKKSTAATNTVEKSDENSLKRKGASTEVETPNKIQKNTDQETKSSDDKAVPSTSKQSESVDLYKPTSSARPLTSRRTAPVTLYSTTPKPSSSTEPTNIKKKD